MADLGLRISDCGFQSGTNPKSAIGVAAVRQRARRTAQFRIAGFGFEFEIRNPKSAIRDY
jgi:hypothetical protein